MEPPRTISTTRRLPRRAVVLALAAVLQVTSLSPASAGWAIPAAGAGGSRAVTVSPGNAPSGSVAGGNVTLTWAASTLSNGATGTDYVVKRYDSSGTTEQTILTGTCALVVSETTCNETAVPPGTWRYSVTPVYLEWRGAQSTTTPVTVGLPSLTLAPLLTATPTTLTGSIADFIAGQTLRFHLDSTSGAELSGTVDGAATPAPVPLSGGAPVTVALPAGTSEGPHTIYAVATPSGQSAGVAVMVDNTPPPAPGITSAPTSPTTSTTADFEFTDAEPGVGFECRLDGGIYAACSSPLSFMGLGDGSHTFEVLAVDGAGNRSVAASHAWTVDTGAPSVSFTFPASGSFHNNTRYNEGCGTASTGDICGASSDAAGTGVVVVKVSVRQGTGNYWDGTGFSSATEVLFDASGTTNWSYGFAAASFPSDGPYTIRAAATDALGNTGTTSSTFTIDRTAPFAADVQTANTSGGTVGRAQAGDTITFTYSEPIDPASILTGWDGSATNVVVRINHTVVLVLLPGPDLLQVWNASNSTRLPFGEVDLGGTDYVSANVTFGAGGTPATMVQNGSSITITLGTVSNAGSVTTAGAAGTMAWTPSSTARDLAGNSSLATARNESGAADKEF